MKRLFLVCAIAGLIVAMGSIAWAAVNLNSSKSNIYRLVYDESVVTSAQAASIGAELDKIGSGVNEPKVLQLLRTQGINAPNLIVRIVPPGPGGGNSPAILILKNQADEVQARQMAVQGSGVGNQKSIVIPKQ